VKQLYHLELDRVVEEIRRRGADRVLLQLPDGLRPLAFRVVKALREGTGANVFLSGDSCYGACDLAVNQARELSVDLIVHYGHSRMIVDGDVPVLYVNAEVDVDAVALVDEAAPLMSRWRRIGLVTTVQHVHMVDEIRELLRVRGFMVYVGEGAERAPHPGQVLGCHYGNAQAVAGDVEAYLYVGGGEFHPKGLILSTGKPVVVADPYNASVRLMTMDDLMRLAKRRVAQIAAAGEAERIGVLVSSKPGQRATMVAETLRSRFAAKGCEAVIIYLDEVRAEHLNNFVEAQAFVDTACPRVAIDGVSGVDRPILTVREAEVVLGDRRWEDIWGDGYLG
jgi:2-(3-amino-3-carboxypropyl)histidine synthase